MRKKNYFQPTMLPYKLKAQKIMAGSISRVNTNTSKDANKPDLEDFQTVSSTSVWGN